MLDICVECGKGQSAEVHRTQHAFVRPSMVWAAQQRPDSSHIHCDEYIWFLSHGTNEHPTLIADSARACWIWLAEFYRIVWVERPEQAFPVQRAAREDPESTETVFYTYGPDGQCWYVTRQVVHVEDCDVTRHPIGGTCIAISRAGRYLLAGIEPPQAAGR